MMLGNQEMMLGNQEMRLGNQEMMLGNQEIMLGNQTSATGCPLGHHHNSIFVHWHNWCDDLINIYIEVHDK